MKFIWLCPSIQLSFSPFSTWSVRDRFSFDPTETVVVWVGRRLVPWVVSLSSFPSRGVPRSCWELHLRGPVFRRKCNVIRVRLSRPSSLRYRWGLRVKVKGAKVTGLQLTWGFYNLPFEVSVCEAFKIWHATRLILLFESLAGRGGWVLCLVGEQVAQVRHTRWADTRCVIGRPSGRTLTSPYRSDQFQSSPDSDVTLRTRRVEWR